MSKYEMATLELREDMALDAKVARLLARQAVALNKALGDLTSWRTPRLIGAQAPRSKRFG